MERMENIDSAQLVYLLVLAVAIIGYMVAENRASLGRMARQAITWGLLFVGMIAGYGLWQDISANVVPRQLQVETGAITVPRARDGHFYLTLQLDGVPVRFVVDTGATDVVLSQDDARRVGIDPGALVYAGRAGTANGEVATALATIGTVQLEDITDRNMAVRVNGGEMDGSLLGMSYLRRFSRLEIAGDRLILQR